MIPMTLGTVVLVVLLWAGTCATLSLWRHDKLVRMAAEYRANQAADRDMLETLHRHGGWGTRLQPEPNVRCVTTSPAATAAQSGGRGNEGASEPLPPSGANK